MQAPINFVPISQKTLIESDGGDSIPDDDMFSDNERDPLLAKSILTKKDSLLGGADPSYSPAHYFYSSQQFHFKKPQMKSSMPVMRDLRKERMFKKLTKSLAPYALHPETVRGRRPQNNLDKLFTELKQQIIQQSPPNDNFNRT